MALYFCVHSIPLCTLVYIQKCYSVPKRLYYEPLVTQNNAMGSIGLSVRVHMSTHHVLLCTRHDIFLCTQLDLFMYTRVHNRMLCTQEYKPHSIVESVEAFCICFGDSHYTLTSVYTIRPT